MKLTDNAFAVLGARPADDRMTLNEKADEAALLGGGDTDGALNQLMQLNRRISAELGWFPGASDEAVDAFLEYARELSEGRPARVPPVEDLGTALAQGNALSALFEVWPADDQQLFEALCYSMDSILSQVTVDETLQAVNGDRRKGNWEPIPDAIDLMEPLNERLRELCAPLRPATERMPVDALAETVRKLLDKGGIDVQGSVAQTVMDGYTMRVHEKMESLKQKILADTGRLGKADTVGKGAMEDVITMTGQWCDLTAPLRLVPGAVRNDARAIGSGVRDVVVNYVNKAGGVKQKKSFTFPIINGTRTVTVEYQSQEPYVQEARNKTHWLMTRFPEQVDLISRLKGDERVLDQIQQKERDMLRDAETRARLQAMGSLKR